MPNDEAGQKAAMAAWQKANPEPRATLAQVADHIDHVRKVAGIDHIGLGSDFDGITSVPVGLEDVSTYPALTVELLKRGYSDDDVKKILGLNVLRVMRQVERVVGRAARQARALDGDDPGDSTARSNRARTVARGFARVGATRSRPAAIPDRRGRPSSRTDQCRCGPVTRPVAPDLPQQRARVSTRAPSFTSKADRCAIVE